MPPVTPELVNALTRRARKTQHGFTDILRASNEVVAQYPARDCLRLAKQLFASDVHQARMLAVFIFGRMYVHKSAGNALRDISRQHPALVRAEVETWDRSDRRVAQTYKLASKFLR
jgi:hypothetical protein